MATVRKHDEVKQDPNSRDSRSNPSRQKSPAASKRDNKKSAKPGSSGEGNYFHVGVHPSTGFETFRTQDVGDPGHIQRVAGQRSDGSWETVKWLIGKEDAHIEGDKLIPDSKDAEKLFHELEAEPIHIEGDIFEAKSGGADKTDRRKSQPSQHK